MTPADQMYGMGVAWYETLFTGLVWIYDAKTDKMDVELATSRNGRHWDRLFRDPLIPTGNQGTWDYGMVNTANTPPIRVGDELWIYYTGIFHTHGGAAARRRCWPGHDSPRWVRLRQRRRKSGVPGYRPVVLNGKSLFVNAQVNPGGYLKAELRDIAGQANRQLCPR